MDKDRLPYILLYGYIHGSRGKGRPKKRWIDNIREDCMEYGHRNSNTGASHIATDGLLEEHCSENGLPECEDIVFDVTAISQVSHIKH